MTRRLLLRLAVVAVLTLTACGGDDAEDTAATTSTTASTSTTAPAAPGDGDGPGTPVGSPAIAPVETDEFPRGGGGTALLVDVRVGAHEAFDRLVLEFEGDTPPSYRVGYVDPPVRQDFSGNEVDVAGDAFIELRASPAAGFDPLSDDAEETYTGPDRLSPEDTGAVREVVRIGDFEGQLAWVVGVPERLPFGVTMLEEPLRLVMDVLHAPNGSSGIDLTNECSFAEAGWEIVVPYPSGWLANEETVTDTGTVPSCRIFDPDDATPPRAQELTAFGFLVHVDPVDFDDIEGQDGAAPDAELLEEEQRTVDGRRAVCREDRLNQTGLRGPSGARVTTCTVDLDGSILVARTHEVADLDYERNRAVLDAVMERLAMRRVAS